MRNAAETQRRSTIIDIAVLQGKKIVLGVTGGIAAYKSVEVCRLLTSAGAHVVPILTDAAMQMVGKKTFDALASEPAKTSMWEDTHPSPHTFLGQSADLVLICPATARIISDYRVGRSADLLSATLLATEAPVVICPAMHSEMWFQPAVQENISVLADRGVHIVAPDDGPLAGGDSGVGRLAAPAAVVETAMEVLADTTAKPLVGVSVLITAGGTREPIDPVRFLANKSSGKQGHAVAEVARQKGAEVTLVTTSDIETHKAITSVHVDTAAQMHDAVMAHYERAHVIVMAAAVADFTIANTAEHKIKKADGTPTLRLEPTVDILKTLGEVVSDTQLLVGFAAETQDVLVAARKKLIEKKANYIVANNVVDKNTGFAYDTNQVTIVCDDGSETEVSLRSKLQVAEVIWDEIIVRLSKKDSHGS